VITVVAAALGPHALARRPGACLEGLRCDARRESFQRSLGPLCVSAGLIADSLQLRNAALQHRVGEIGNAVLDGVVEPLELGVDLGRPFAQGGDMRGSALGALLAAIEHGR
jgi:hypothetical protein